MTNEKVVFNPARLKTERIASNHSAKYVAEKIGCSQSTLYRKELGKSNITGEELAIFMGLYKVKDPSVFTFNVD